MATPMRSTDFRSIVEPILNDEFDGVVSVPGSGPARTECVNRRAVVECLLVCAALPCIRGCSSSVEWKLPKLQRRVRLPSSALVIAVPAWCRDFSYRARLLLRTA